MIQLWFFLLSFALGAVLRVVYFLQRALAKKTALYPITVGLDFIWCGIAFASFFLISLFLTGGQFHFYMLCGTLAGFFLVSVWL